MMAERRLRCLRLDRAKPCVFLCKSFAVYNGHGGIGRGFGEGPSILLYSFDRFQLDTSTRELQCDHEVLSVEPKVFDLLSYLIVNRARVVSKDDLIANVWN